jgi:hypothetical protein
MNVFAPILTTLVEVKIVGKARDSRWNLTGCDSWKCIPYGIEPNLIDRKLNPFILGTIRVSSFSQS